MAIKYKMIQVPPTISVKEKEHKGTEAAVYLESVVNQMAAQGWQFYRVDSIGVELVSRGSNLYFCHVSGSNPAFSQFR